MSELKTVSAAPHLRSSDSTPKIMGLVILALLPATLVGVYQFKQAGLQTLMVCLLSSYIFELLFQRIMKQKATVDDLSALLTGLLLGLNMPPTAPIWVSIIGSFFAIVVVKQFFGGLGHNFVNPALGGRAFLLIAYTDIMTTFTVDSVSTATPLGMIKEGGEFSEILSLALGLIPGSLGEVSALALLAGGIFLIYKKVITFHIPVFYIGTVILMVVLFGGYGFDLNFILIHVLSGGLMLGAFFMATDYVTSPATTTGKIIMGVGCGVLTAVIRLFGGYPEGVSFAILIMNLCVPLIDKFFKPKRFGGGTHE